MNLLYSHEIEHIHRNVDIDELKFMPYYTDKISGEYTMLFDGGGPYYINMSRQNGTNYISVRMIGRPPNHSYAIPPDSKMAPDERRWNYKM